MVRAGRCRTHVDVFEHVFDHGGVETAALLDRLRAQVAQAEARVRPQLLEVPAALAKVLPEPGLRPGATYCLDGAGALLQALLAEPSAAGHWCGVVGVPTFAAEAAAAAGVRLERLVLVPEPGDQWLAVVGALAEVIDVLAIRVPSRVRESDAARLGARLRDRGVVLLAIGDWPRAEARLRVTAPHWRGLGQGHGHLVSRRIRVEVTSRRSPAGRGVTVELPAATGGLADVLVESTRLRVAG